MCLKYFRYIISLKYFRYIIIMSKSKKKKKKVSKKTRSRSNKITANNCNGGEIQSIEDTPHDEHIHRVEGVSNLLSINVPKKENKGEDADPLIHTSEDRKLVFVGVFDGMGGSGATEYTTKNGVHTGAYLASRKVSDTCKGFIMTADSDILDIDALSVCIKDDLKQCMEDNNIKPSVLRGAIMRTLPTTLAIIGASTSGSETHITSYWCGDSRNYILTKDGLLQVSLDDLSKTQDPLENLRNDESLSNCICQDRSFEIHQKDCGVFKEPVIILSATDGCFGYLKSPMHFEYLLLQTMQESQNIEEWKCNIENWLTPISGDDFSIGLAMIGGDFEYWKNIMIDELKNIQKSYINPIEKSENTIKDLQHKVLMAQQGSYDTITTLWNHYSNKYMSLIKEQKK